MATDDMNTSSAPEVITHANTRARGAPPSAAVTPPASPASFAQTEPVTDLTAVVPVEASPSTQTVPVPLRAAGSTPARDYGQAFARVPGGKLLGVRSGTPITIQKIMVGAREFDVAGQDPVATLCAAGADAFPANVLVTVIAENATDAPVTLQIELDLDGAPAPPDVSVQTSEVIGGTPQVIVSGTQAQGQVIEAGAGSIVRSGGSQIIEHVTRVGAGGSMVRDWSGPPQPTPNEGGAGSAPRVIDVAGIPLEPGKAQLLLMRGHAALYRTHLETALALPLGVRRPVAHQLLQAFEREEPLDVVPGAGEGEQVILAPRAILMPLFYALQQDYQAEDGERSQMIAALDEADRRDQGAAIDITATPAEHVPHPITRLLVPAQNAPAGAEPRVEEAPGEGEVVP